MTIQEIRSLSRAAGSHWFDADTMRFFRSRVSAATFPTVPGGPVFFVSSEQFVGAPRRFTVRAFDPSDGGVDTVGDFQAYGTLAKAKAAARHAAAVWGAPAKAV